MSKDKLFRMLEYLDPSFNKDRETLDVRNAENLKTTSLKNANSKISNHDEFRQAFDNWFGDLGVSGIYKNNFNSTTAISDIRKIFDKYNIKS